MRRLLGIIERRVRNYWLWSCFMVAIFPVQQAAAQAEVPSQTGTSAEKTSQGAVEYSAAYFTRYQPNTALDMVDQIPGFLLDDGDGTRGFASSAGNILINGRRPSAKQDVPSATLARIPASQVERIELLRGQVEGVDMQGHSVLANVYLRTDTPASVRWELWAEQNKAAPFKPGGSISMSDRLGDIDFNTGIDVERNTSGWKGLESRYDANGALTETGPTNSREKGYRLNGLSLNASTWMGANFVQFNSRLTFDKSNYFRPNSSVSQLPGNMVQDVIIDLTNKHNEYELGADVERNLSSNLVGKLIFLYVNRDSSSYSSQENSDSILGRTLFRVAETDAASEEQISRLEFDWSSFKEHAVQFNIERAYNVLDQGLVKTDDRGLGPVFVDVPGANTRVKEVRWDLLLQDTWSHGNIELDFGLGAEASTLSQTGDAELVRDFFFLKPLAVLSYTPGLGNQSRIRLAREVSQLDLRDFVSATVFEDDDLALGNPNIRPQTTLVAEVSHEKRFGKDRVIKVTGFHHWITDVLDLLPLSASYEAPGNIGDGRRWGVELESTLPLVPLGLPGAKIDFRALWQDSQVTDPVTGLKRRLSGDGGGSGYRTLATLNTNMAYHLRADFRQDFEAARVAWGWTVADRGERPLYKVNELDVHSEGAAVNVFIETTRWFGIKIRLAAENMLNFRRNRERTIFVGERDLTPVESILVRSRQHDIYRFALYLNGSF